MGRLRKAEIGYLRHSQFFKPHTCGCSQGVDNHKPNKIPSGWWIWDRDSLERNKFLTFKKSALVTATFAIQFEIPVNVPMNDFYRWPSLWKPWWETKTPREKNVETWKHMPTPENSSTPLQHSLIEKSFSPNVHWWPCSLIFCYCSKTLEKW